MGIEYSSVIDSSRDEVFAWHDRPGAIRRLLPPWQPLSVVSEARSWLTGAPSSACPADSAGSPTTSPTSTTLRLDSSMPSAATR